MSFKPQKWSWAPNPKTDLELRTLNFHARWTLIL
jgi:hypothetical protein